MVVRSAGVAALRLSSRITGMRGWNDGLRHVSWFQFQMSNHIQRSHSTESSFRGVAKRCRMAGPDLGLGAHALQFAPRPVQSRLDGPNGAAADERSFFVAEAGGRYQHQYLAMLD